jgi:hypothetical protein
VPLQVSSLVQQGWLTATSKTGLIYNDEPDYAVVPDLVAKALKAAGMPALLEKQAMPGVDDTSRVGSASSSGQNASLRFASRGIDRVLVVDKSGQAIGYFAIASQNQNYYPAYGISSLQLPNILRTVLSARQLENAHGIGWSPAVDLAVSKQTSPNANYKDCLLAMSKAGENMGAAATRHPALATCDAVLLMAAVWRDSQLTASTFVDGMRALGRRYPSVMTLATDFTRRDAAAAYRPMAFDAGCDCFRYTGPQQSTG